MLSRRLVIAPEYLLLAQQPDRVRRIAMLRIIAETDPQHAITRQAFIKQLHQLGWRTGDNVQIDNRATADANRLPAYAAELIGLGPDLIVAEGTPGLAAVQQVREYPRPQSGLDPAQSIPQRTRAGDWHQR